MKADDKHQATILRYSIDHCNYAINNDYNLLDKLIMFYHFLSYLKSSAFAILFITSITSFLNFYTTFSSL
jgi:hypothetical protein